MWASRLLMSIFQGFTTEKSLQSRGHCHFGGNYLLLKAEPIRWSRGGCTKKIAPAVGCTSRSNHSFETCCKRSLDFWQSEFTNLNGVIPLVLKEITLMTNVCESCHLILISVYTKTPCPTGQRHILLKLSSETSIRWSWDCLMHVCVCLCICVYLFCVYLFMSICVSICVWVYLCVCFCV